VFTLYDVYLLIPSDCCTGSLLECVLVVWRLYITHAIFFLTGGVVQNDRCARDPWLGLQNC